MKREVINPRKNPYSLDSNVRIFPGLTKPKQTLRYKTEGFVIFMNENKLCLLLFFLSLFLFIYQHYATLSWDFSSYVLNSRYLFYNGTYFETFRPPMVPVLLAPFLIFGVIGEYLYIILISILFFYSSLKLSDIIFKKWIEEKKQDKYFLRFIFYFFSLSFFSMCYAFSAGSELLALAFFELFIVSLLNNRISGFYLGLACLTRYNFLIFSPLLFLNKDYKKIMKNLLIFFLIMFPWLLFNYIKFGNWFASIIDSYANNILFRDYILINFNILDVLNVIGYFLPFLILGLVYAVYSLIKFRKNWFSENKMVLLFILIALFVLFDYGGIPLKNIRYLFNLILPIAFFSTFGLLAILRLKNKDYLRKTIILIFIITFLISFYFLYSDLSKTADYDNKYYNSAKDIKELGIVDCEILSPAWVIVTYFTENVYPLGGNPVNESLNQGKIMLIFKDSPTLDDVFSMSDLEAHSKLKETDEYTFFVKKNFSSKNCAKKYVFDEAYVQDHCSVISEKFKDLKLDNFVLKFCKIINRNQSQ